MKMMADFRLATQVLEELSDGAYSTRGADISILYYSTRGADRPAEDLISQIKLHCTSHREKNIDQDSSNPAGIW